MMTIMIPTTTSHMNRPHKIKMSGTGKMKARACWAPSTRMVLIPKTHLPTKPLLPVLLLRP